MVIAEMHKVKYLKNTKEKYLKIVLDKRLFHKYNNKVPVEKQYIWDLSSAGRASALQAEGHRFEPYRSHFYVKNDSISGLSLTT